MTRLAPLLDALRRRLLPRVSSFEGVREYEASRLLFAGIIVGALGAMTAVVFDHLMSAIGELVLGTSIPAREAPLWWRALLGPPVVGLLVGLLVHNLTRRGRPQGMADVVARVQLDEPTLSLRDGAVSALAAALAVGSGFSGGREGPIVQFASSLAARVCRRLDVRPTSVRTLVAAGAGAAIAASFNTPLGGAFFALEIILGNFAVETFAPVVAATVTGTVVGQAFLGDRIALHLPPFTFHSPFEFPLYFVLGGIGALVAHTFKRAVVAGAARIERVTGPAWLRPSLLGLLVGATAAGGLNEVMGNGYTFMEDMLHGEHGAALVLLAILFAKVAATTLTVAARTGAGLFAASLFVGAVTGATFGLGVHELLPLQTEAMGAYGIVGMGAVAASVLNAPITMTLMLFEMTGNYHVILPLMFALAAGAVMSGALGSRSLEDMELERRGLSLAKRRDAGVMHQLRVGDVFRATGFETLPEGTPLPDVVARFLSRRVEEIYVVDPDGRYRGSVHIQDIKSALADPEEEQEAARPRVVTTVRVTETLAAVLPRFFDAPGDGLPVVDDEGHLLGVLAERDVVATYHREALRTDARKAHIVRGSATAEPNEFLELPEGQILQDIVVGPGRAGATLRALSLRKTWGCTVVAMGVWDAGKNDWTRQSVDIDRVLQAEDKLSLIGPESAVHALAAQPGSA